MYVEIYFKLIQKPYIDPYLICAVLGNELHKINVKKFDLILVFSEKKAGYFSGGGQN
jgi:hypothetical protein